MNRKYASLLATLFLATAVPVAAQVGSEFQVNTWTTERQYDPSVGVDPNGNFVVVWNSWLQDGSSNGIFGQRFDAAGNPLGSEFQVNTFTSIWQLEPSVGVDPDGNFVVAWHSYGQDGSNNGVFGQRFDATGNPLGSEFQVNTWTNNQQLRASVGVGSDGAFVVAWTSINQDGSRWGVFGQRFDASGNAQGSEFQVNDFTTDWQTSASVAIDSDGDFVVAWQSYGQDGSNYAVFAKRYDSAGNALGSEFQINTWTSDSQAYPSVGFDSDGNFVVVWQSSGQDGSGYGIFGRRFDASGNALGSEFQINTWTSNLQFFPAVGVDTTGDFVVAWNSRTQDGSGDGVFAKRFDAAGNAVGSEFQVNTWTSNYQASPSVGIAPEGQFIVAWQSQGQDGSDWGVFAALSTSTLVLEKQTDPNDPNTIFTFDTSALDPNDPNVATSTLRDDEQVRFGVLPGTYRIDEILPPGYELTLVACTAIPSDPNTPPTTFDPNDPNDATGANITVQTSQTVTCVFNNRRLDATLDVTKTVSPERIAAGETVTWTVNVTNQGPDPAEGVTLTDDLPDGVEYVSSSTTQGSCSESAGVVTCDLGTILAAQTVTVEIEAEVLVHGDVVNEVTVTGNSGFATGAAAAPAVFSAGSDIPVDDPWMLALLALTLAIAGAAIVRRS